MEDLRLKPDTAPQPGIDLARYHHDVRRLTLARWKGPALALDPEDLVQEVYRRILRRNRLACAWDPARGSLGHYVHRIAGCAIADMLKPVKRRARHEVHSEQERLEAEPAPEPHPEDAPLDLDAAPADADEREDFFLALCCLEVFGETPARTGTAWRIQDAPVWARALVQRRREQTAPGQLTIDGRVEQPAATPAYPSVEPSRARVVNRRGPRADALPDPRQQSLF